MIQDLSKIGFYTLDDARVERVRRLGILAPLWRAELLITDACNFKCPYCRGPHDGQQGTLTEAQIMEVLDFWFKEGLTNVRFSGGEPTLHRDLNAAVRRCKEQGVKRIAISTNGSRDRSVYEQLLRDGVNDFSISLDACCSATGDTMAGGIDGAWESVIRNIEWLAREVYVTVGVVVTDVNAPDLQQTIALAANLGVADIRVIPAAQLPATQFPGTKIVFGKEALKAAETRPILRYRIANMKDGRPFRGIYASDSRACPLVLDDMAVCAGKHYPCIIYLREGGAPIGDVSADMRHARRDWYLRHDTHKDPICRRNCLDVCVDYNNRHLEGVFP